MRLINIEDVSLLKTVSCGGLSAKALWKRIKEQPTVDAVEVVRCKDCYHAEDDITHMFCVYFHHKVYEDDYCSNAVERREDGDEE